MQQTDVFGLFVADFVLLGFIELAQAEVRTELAEVLQGGFEAVKGLLWHLDERCARVHDRPIIGLNLSIPELELGELEHVERAP